jgi:hypothetical protein
MLRQLPGLLLLFSLLIGPPAAAHDSWIAKGGYRGPANGEWCCGQNDCFVVPGSQVKPNGVGYELRSHSEMVPYTEVLRSEDGQYWRCKRRDGSRRCFFAPPPSS